MKYIFFYDETEHSRKINYETVTANNYYDNFITGIVGWKAEEDECISDRYLAFESKYAYRKKDGELKSQTMKAKDFRLGFASLNNHTIEFYEDLVSLFDEKIIIYFSVFSKIEYVISQLFVNYHSSMFVDVDYMKYSIIKAINVYRPQNVIEAIYKEPQIFVKELRSFLEDRIIKNQANTTLKEHENQAFQEILLLLEDTEVSETLDWSYFAPFDGFKKLLTEMNVNEYQLMIDREGKESHTLNSAKNVGLKNVIEEDSKDYVGIRMADMLAGLISRLIHDMMIIADGYMKAAIMLAQDCLQDNMDKKADIVVSPMLFSANHAIELYLKSINWSLNMLLNEKESFCGGHDIRQIWNIVKKRMISFESDEDQRKQFKEMTKELDDYILELYDKIDKDHNANAKMKNMDFSRYPFNTDDEYHFYIENYGNEVVDLEMFVEVFKKIGDNLNCIAGYYEEMATFVPDYD